MPYGNDVAGTLRSFNIYKVHQGTAVVSANKFGYGEYIGPGVAISGMGYLGIMPSGAVIEGRLTDRIDNINYYE